MAKRDEGTKDDSLPDLDTLLTGEPPAPPEAQAGATPSAKDKEVLEGPPPPPPGTGRRTGRKVRVAAQARTGEKAGAMAKGTPNEEVEGRGRLARLLGPPIHRLAKTLMMVVPQDPIERMRWRLRWLGIAKFPTAFLVWVVVSIFFTLYLWYLLFEKAETLMVYSREVPVLVPLAPIGVAFFTALYFSFNRLVLNRYERLWTERLDGMLDGSIPVEAGKGRKRKDKGPAPKAEA